MLYHIRKLYHKTYLFRAYILSVIGGLIMTGYFKKVRSYCMFIGYPRSGHSIIGALIDAHPNAIIGMQTDVLKLVEAGFSKRQIYYLAYVKSKQFTKIHDNIWSGYSYKVPDSFQGKFTDLLVIGDKQGAKSSIRLGNNPSLIQTLQSKTGCPVKMLHVVRNPFDVISTMYLRNVSREINFDRQLLEHKIRLFLKKADINQRLIGQSELSIITIFHETFIENPRNELLRILRFLGLEVNKRYLDHCASIIYKEPHFSRSGFAWPEDLKRLLQDKLKDYSFLTHYEF